MRSRILVPLVLLVVALGACGTDDRDGGHGAGDPPAATGPAGVDLTKDWGCGYGFAVSDKAQQTMLVIEHQGHSTRLTRSVALPDPDWHAEVRVGTDLAANWCSDLIVDPQADVSETWRVVAGTLTFEGDLPSIGTPTQRPDDRHVRATLTGAVVANDSGDRVELGDVALRNDAWGLFAG